MLALVVVLAEDFELLPFLSDELLLPLTFAVSTTTSGVPFRSGVDGAAPLISGFSELPVVALLVDVVAVPVVPVPFVPVLTNTKSTAS